MRTACACALRTQVTKAFRQQSLLVHPDKNSAAQAEEAFKRVHAAYIALKEEVAQGRGQPPRPSARNAPAPAPHAARYASGARAYTERSYEPPRGREQPFSSESFHWG